MRNRFKPAKRPLPIPAIPRQAGSASSILRSLRRRPLRFFAYAWGEAPELPGKTQWDVIQGFKHWGFPVNPLMKLCHSAEELLERYRYHRDAARDPRL